MPRKLITLLIIATILVSGVVLTGKYNSGERFVFFGDVMGYYVYLPATFIYDNLQDMDQLPADAGIPEGVHYYTKWLKQYSTEAGLDHWLNQYTYPVALMETPFFLAAHLYEKMAGLPANGYSSSYAAGILASSIVYSLLGLLLVYKILRRYFNHLHALLAATLVLMGTNMLWFTFAQAGMSHIPLFFLYALLMYITVRLYEKPRTVYFIAAGLTAGLITTMRPSDVLCLLIPLLYGVYDKNTWLQRWQFIREHFSRMAIAAFCFLLPAIPQLLYWKLITGKYLYYSYLEQSFNWTDPKIFEGLFSTGNGWLPYAPVMIFALAGLPLRNNVKQWRLPVFVILPLFIYIIYSWFCYNYINGFGSRPMLHVYPLLALPLATFIQFISRKGIAAKTLFAAACTVGVGIVFSLSLLQAQRKYESDYAKPQFYLQMLFKSKLTYEDLLVADLGQFQPDTGKLKKMATLAINDFDTAKDEHYVPDPNDSTGYVYHVKDGEEYFADKIKIVYRTADFEGAKWLKCSGRFMRPQFANNNPHYFIFGVQDEKNEYVVWKACVIDNKIGLADNSCAHASTGDFTLKHTEYGLWGEVYFYVKMPDNLQDGQVISLDIWNTGKVQFYLDDFKLELYK